MRHFIGWLTVAASLAATGVVRADDISEAQTLFDQGIADLQAGKTDQACKELAASLAKHEDSGTKGALATCYGKIDKLASAWGLWKDLVDTEPNPDMKADATKQAAALEPKLGHYVVKVATPPPGLVVTVNGSALKDFSVSVPLPIDAGTVAVSASAPGYKPWSGSATAADGQLTTIEVPALVAAPKEVAGRTYDPAEAAAAAETRHKRHVLAISAAGVGAAAIIVGGVFGHQASSDFDQSKRDCGGNLDACPGTGITAAQSAFNSANKDATASTVLFVVGGAALTGAAVLWFTAPELEERPPATAWRVAPSVDPHGGGFVVSGGF